jgi:hypothetical protein
LMNGKVHEISQRRSSRNKRLGRGGFSSLHGLLGMALAAAALAMPVSPASCRGGSNPPERRRGSSFSLPSRSSFVLSASPEAWNPNRMSASKAGCCPSSARPSPSGNAPRFAALPRRPPSPSAATSMAMAKELGTALSCACASVLLLASPSSLQPPPARASLPVWAAESTAPASPPAAAERKAGGGGDQAGGEKKQAATSEKAGVDKKPAAIAEPTIKLPQNPITPNKDGEPQPPNDPTNIDLGTPGPYLGALQFGSGFTSRGSNHKVPPSCPAPWKQQFSNTAVESRARAPGPPP